MRKRESVSEEGGDREMERESETERMRGELIKRHSERGGD